MRRRTHMDIYVRDAQIWKRDLGYAEARRDRAERELALERREWADVLDKLTYMRHEGVDYALVGGAGEPRNLVYREIVQTPVSDSTTFAFRVTNHLLNGSRRALAPTELQFVADIIAGETSRLLVSAFVNGEYAR